MRIFNVRKKRNKYDATGQILERINGRAIKYVAMRDEDGVEAILGKNGRIVATQKEIAVTCDAADVFLCKRQGAVVAELLSLDGVRIEGECGDGKIRSVTAYYTYYRK